jgi:hypothetical protein
MQVFDKSCKNVEPNDQTVMKATSKLFLKGAKTFKNLNWSCNLTYISSCLTGSVDYLFASRHKGPGFKSPGEYLCKTGILLLALSRYELAFKLKDRDCEPALKQLTAYW